MFCGQCGTEIPEGGVFCPDCGSRLIADNVQGSETLETAQNSMMPEQNEAAANGAVVMEPSATQGTQKKFCPNCGVENSMADTYCKECGMPLDGTVYSVGAVGRGMQMNQPLTGAGSNKKKGLMLGICAAAVLVLAVVVLAVSRLTLDPKGKVLQAIAATMKDTPEVVGNLKKSGDILSADSFTLGLNMEVDGDTVNGEFRDTTSEKQIYLSMDIDGDELGLLCGVHSGVFKAEILDGDYLFMYDPEKDNDGYLCKQMRKKNLEQLNAMLENITSDKVSAKELKKELMSALMKESEELEFKDAKEKEFEVDGKDRKCGGYKVRISEKNIARFVEYAGEIMSKRMPKNLADELDNLIEEIKDDDFDADITFYLYKKKLAAIIFEADDYGDGAWVIEFRGGDYRMQNMVISLQYDGDTYGEVEISSRKKGNVETISIESDADAEAAITYDTKSGAVSLEYDNDRTGCLIEGVYKCSGSEVSFVLEEFELDGDSIMEDEDVRFTIYAKKAVDIQEYSGEEFDLGGADKDDFEDLVDELKENSEFFEDWFYKGNTFVGLQNFFSSYYYTGADSALTPAIEAPAAEAPAAW